MLLVQGAHHGASVGHFGAGAGRAGAGCRGGARSSGRRPGIVTRELEMELEMERKWSWIWHAALVVLHGEAVSGFPEHGSQRGRVL